MNLRYARSAGQREYRFFDSHTNLIDLLAERSDVADDVVVSAAGELRLGLGMMADAQNRRWLTCPATLDRDRTRLIAHDLATNRKVIDHELRDAVEPGAVLTMESVVHQEDRRSYRSAARLTELLELRHGGVVE